MFHAFLSKNTTSKLQPTDIGITRNLKVKYRKHLAENVVSMLDSQSSAANIIKEVHVIKAIYWINQAWKELSEENISFISKSKALLKICIQLMEKKKKKKIPTRCHLSL